MRAIPRKTSRRLAPSLCVFLVLGGSYPGAGAAPERIFRCGNLYTNVDKAGAPGCEPLSMDRISVVHAELPLSKVVPRPMVGARPASAMPSARISRSEQHRKDADSRQILEAEWRKAHARLQELQAEYNRGEPERLGTERDNPQKYLGRVAALRSSIARTEADISGIRRELARMGVAAQP